MTIFIYTVFIIVMGALGRMSGNGFGSKWGLAWIPEAIYALPFGAAAAYAFSKIVGIEGMAAIFNLVFFAGAAISYAGMQSATWTFLRWEAHPDPDMNRSSTLKPIVDFLAKPFGCKLGDEGYAWIAASFKGFIIGLPVGGIVTAILWPLGYEIGSHARGRVEKFGIKDSHAVSEFLSAAGGGFAIVLFIEFIKGI